MLMKLKRGILALMLGALVAGAYAPGALAAGEDLAAKFQNPPDSAKPHTWWHWMNGNVTKAGITADLEAMKKVGVGGAQIFNAKEGIPHGPVNFMSPEWLEMVRFACAEADRLGIELCIHNCAGWSSSGGPWITPDHAMQTVVNSQTQVTGPKKLEATLTQPPTRLGYYRDIAVLAYRAAGGAVKHEEILDLSKAMDAAGKLTWDVPAGNWVIVRVGYTPTGQQNHPAPDEGTGLECDKLDRGGMDQHWAGIMKPLLEKLGPLAGKSLNNALIDSYEVGEQNWSPSFREEFKKRRGYDPVPFLMTIGNAAARGRRAGAAAPARPAVVDSADVTARFRWDMQRTISDLFAENYYSYFAELCHKAGLKASIEPYTGPFESLQVGAPADIPMGEFWSGSNGHGSVKLAASVGHIYGRPVIGAESFTAGPENGKWTNDPWSIKALGDMVYCTGVNRYIFHRYAMQPWTDRFPGMTMGQWGFHFERTNTWWEQGAAWLKYCARCQALLQSGQFMADIAYFNGENAPSEIPGKSALRPALPDGYDYDCLGAEVLMKHMKVKEGRIVLDSGMSYRVLALPDSGKYTPAVLAKIAELVKAGATVVGRPATGSPSLQDYPKCDDQVKQLGGELWGADAKPSGDIERTVGQGKVVSGKALKDVLAALGVKPDCEAMTRDARILYIHRSVDGAEVYFVSNQRPTFQDVECAFRVNGMTPELWHPDTGLMETAPVYAAADGRTTVKLSFDPAGSVFVVFRKTAAGNHLTEVNFAQAAAPSTEKSAPKLVITKATYAAVDGAGSIDLTAKLADAFASGKTPVEAGNTLAGNDPAYNHVKQLRVEYTYDGQPGAKVFAEGASVELPGGGPGQLNAFPAFELAAADGKLELKAWQAGALSAATAAGKPVKAEVASVPKALEVSGPWALSFPPNWGAPAQVTLDKLISWTDSPETGVKYFSGTATYTKQIEIPAELVGADKALALDLGQVKNFAEVSVNGKNLGVLWKPPFRVDLSGVAKAGANTLEVKVTNMWCNRLIGDEQLPDDREWNGKQLKAWPEWVLKGEKSPTGRFTFTTWHHFTKDSPLYAAGMIGPVVLRAAQKMSVEIPQ